MRWSFIESISMSERSLEDGLETLEKIKRQLDVDIPRSNIIFNGERVRSVDQIIDNDLDVLRCCTQAVFVKPLEHLIKVFPSVYLTHNDGVNIIANVKKCQNGFFGLINKKSESDFFISTSFSARRKSDMSFYFYITMDYVFDFKLKIGTLIFQTKKILT